MLTLPGFEDHGFAPSEWRILLLDPEILERYGVGEAVERAVNGNQPWQMDTTFRHNILLDDGRKMVARHLLDFETPTAYPYMGVGSSTTSTDPTQTGLQTELTGNANRIALTNTNGNPWTSSDFTQETPIGTSFRWKIIAQAIFPTGDGNNGSLFAEWGIANQAAFGGGSKFYNRYLSGSPFTKDSSLAIAAQMLLRT